MPDCPICNLPLGEAWCLLDRNGHREPVHIGCALGLIPKPLPLEPAQRVFTEEETP